ncbi:hypothetical protein EST38_g1580 [Candolleomyces aberdarensis]|uniref:SH3 domain-containing protein n=1 Tax=Candolleomyces aberdarensis TaxID=2316362 RepID=A0A4Q2DZ22_9AGAR|nr:hypothetical protein EST38_g1580 [Candolleomyces aberdarensis]
MPERTLPPRLGAGSREEILQYHRQSGNFPKPFTLRGPASPSSPSFLAPPDRLSGFSGGNSPVSPNRDSRVSWVRHSFMSAASGLNRYSVSSSVASSFGAEPTTGQARKVKQLFQPVLPDELLLTKVGEQLTVVQSFDDGWCVVGKENTSGFQQKKSLFKSAAEEESDVELGVVPAWVFLKPVKGLRAERPIRSTSLGITIQLDAPAASRDMTVSWSNF